jgi:alkaline phosphatase
MKRILFFSIISFFATIALGQEYNSSSIFAHNDYVQPVPFYTAYHHQVGYIEADVFLMRNKLCIAHTRQEIEKDKTLEKLYLKPLQKCISKNNGLVYGDLQKTLVLMIDIKTEGVVTLNRLVKILKKYPQLLNCPTLQVTVSGNVPAPSRWKDYPDFIHFDGRLGIAYNDDQFERISMISSSFRDHSQWNGKGTLTRSDKEKLVSLIDAVHARGKKTRFWATPDFKNAWIQFMKLKVDILNTDDVPGLAAFLKGLANDTLSE